jgi:FlaA1/EpsC-like NDP-sugar epimerase
MCICDLFSVSLLSLVAARDRGKERKSREITMDAARIIGYFKSKSILITGSTGFLGKSIYLFLLNLLR